jgi:hypothetical protein
VSKQKDFATKYAPKIFAISPASSFKGSGCGWSIINCDARSYGGNKNSPLVLRSGILKPFTDLSSLSNMIEFAHKLERIWQEDSGFSRQPKTVVLEKPSTSHSASLNAESIRDIAMFTGILIRIFAPELILAPGAQEWTATTSKENLKKEILDHSDKISLGNINRDMDYIALHNRHNVYDAIGLGIYGGHVTNNQLPLPETFLRL